MSEEQLQEEARRYLGRMLGHRYQIDALLGRGGMGFVFRAIQTRIGRPVAVKILQKQWTNYQKIVDRFLNEPRAAAGVRHPGIIDCLDRGGPEDGEDCVYIVQEFLEGRSLADEVKSRQLSIEESCGILRQVCAAVAAAHSAKIIHRDLKPDNIFLLQSPGELPNIRVKVIDFGIAKLADQLDSAKRTSDDDVFGTPHYMPPEQLMSATAVTEKADVYAIGTILYELLTGRLPYDDQKSLSAWRVAKIKPPAKPPSQVVPAVPVELSEFVMRCLEVDPAERPDLSDLENLLARFGGEPPPMSLSISRTPTPRPRRFVWAALGLLLGVGMCAAAFAAYTAPEDSSEYTLPLSEPCPPCPGCSPPPVCSASPPCPACPAFEPDPLRCVGEWRRAESTTGNPVRIEVTSPRSNSWLCKVDGRAYSCSRSGDVLTLRERPADVERRFGDVERSLDLLCYSDDLVLLRRAGDTTGGYPRTNDAIGFRRSSEQ
ncbi:eukaryotic-like serine/threonine-protein kinase [Planctomycetaceae bacterium]|nr:serine/threonine protein kinase [Sandaracinaceae bacterium]CAG0927186.1 eukaryotic-like serine/threonine-protein kinase [Planctomycetaceae bacterium]